MEIQPKGVGEERSINPELFKMDINCDATDATDLLASRVIAQRVVADLVEEGAIVEKKVYKRFTGIEEKNQYRQELIQTLSEKWIEDLGPEKGEKMTEKFLQLASDLDTHGAVILGAILSKENFTKLIDSYTSILGISGSKSWLHSFVNLANHPDFLTNGDFNKAFMHPLLIALVSHKIGGPVRIVDARGKDAEPIKVLAQDNMLHIDNTPFNDEYKVILAWERGHPSGPKGQNFVFLPGTQHGARQSMQGPQGTWSSENASIFTTPQSVDKLLDFQKRMIGKHAIVELTHDTKPLTTLFAAGSLVHHRHRTDTGLARSCMILAFHRAEDNPGQLIADQHLISTASKSDFLYRVLLGESKMITKQEFNATLAEMSGEMSELMTHLDDIEKEAEQILPKEREMSLEEIDNWKEAVTSAPTVADKKAEAAVVPIGEVLEKGVFIERLGRMMAFDKHGPLDLILYPDAHEEIRKWARNQIREKKIEGPTGLQASLETWKDSIAPPKEEHLRDQKQLQGIAFRLAAIATNKMEDEDKIAALELPGEKISSIDAYRSVRQLSLDLGEAIVRCEDKMAFLSTSLFIFWAADTLMKFDPVPDENIKNLGLELLQNYIATAILVEKEIRQF